MYLNMKFPQGVLELTLLRWPAVLCRWAELCWGQHKRVDLRPPDHPSRKLVLPGEKLLLSFPLPPRQLLRLPGKAEKWRHKTALPLCLLCNRGNVQSLTLSIPKALNFRGRLKFVHGQNRMAEDGTLVHPQLALFAIATPMQPPSIVEIRAKTLLFQTKHKLDFTPMGIDTR